MISSIQFRREAKTLVERIQDKTDKPVAVVVNTGDANSYGIVINLGREGIPVLTVSCDADNITFASRYAKSIVCPDHRELEKEFIDSIVYLGELFIHKPVLFVNGDEQLMILLRCQDRVGAAYHLPYAPYDTAIQLTNKIFFYRLLKELDVPHAVTYMPSNMAEMEVIAQQLEYPYILKPAHSNDFARKFGNKCLRAQSPVEMVDIYSRVASEEDDVIVQKQILGTERFLVYTYFSSESKPLGVCCYRKVRLYPTDFGNACVCETVSDEECVELVIRVLTRIGYHGLAEAEIQRDARDGELKIVEINARSTTEDRLSAYCGINMEFIAYKEVLGLIKGAKCIVNKDMGVLWIDLFRDIMAVFTSGGYLAQNKITVRDWWKSLRGRKVFAYWAWDDPMPAIRLMFHLIRIYGINSKRIVDVFSVLKSLMGIKGKVKSI